MVHFKFHNPLRVCSFRIKSFILYIQSVQGLKGQYRSRKGAGFMYLCIQDALSVIKRLLNHFSEIYISLASWFISGFENV